MTARNYTSILQSSLRNLRLSIGRHFTSRVYEYGHSMEEKRNLASVVTPAFGKAGHQTGH
jgi:hypothetical protein